MSEAHRHELFAHSRKQREEMVGSQLVARGIRDGRVLDAMRAVPREEFVPEELLSSAYKDCPLPIGSGQTISQPYTVAMMCEALELSGSEKVLEVGAGSGYAACVLSHLAREVHSVERIAELASHAQQRVRRLGYRNVMIHLSDGSVGFPSEAPFDAIIVAAGAPQLPRALEEQLCESGRILIPIGPTRSSQLMTRFTRRDRKLREETLGAFVFVPLIGDAGWDEL